MAQGTRVRWIRAATAGFGVMLCTGFFGCMPWEKSKDTKSTNPPKPGLPGTPQLPAGGAAAARQPGGSYTGAGANLQQPGFATSGASGGFRPGTTGLNTNTSTAAQPSYGTAPTQPNFGAIGSPALPGVTPSVQPASGIGGPVGAAPGQYNSNIAQAGYTPTASPPPPDLLGGPLPPPAPALDPGTGSAPGAVLPPVPPTGPLAPIAPIKGGF